MNTNQPNPTGWRILAFGKEAATAAKLEEQLRSLGYRATVFALTDDADGDSRLSAELARGDWDGISIGSFINGQDPHIPPTEQRTRWFNRVVNLIHAGAPRAKIVLARGPSDVATAIHLVLGPNPD